MNRFFALLMLLAAGLMGVSILAMEGGDDDYYYAPPPKPKPKPKPVVITYNYEGTVGSTPVKISLTQGTKTSNDRLGSLKFVSGTASQNGASGKVDGYDWSYSNSTVLQEYADNGTHTATWDLDGFLGDDTLHGEYMDLSNKKSIKVDLKKVK